MVSTAAAVEATDQARDRRSRDPRRTGKAVDHALAGQRRKALRCFGGRCPATDRPAADTHPVTGDRDHRPRLGSGPQPQTAAGLGLDRSAAGAANPRDREVGHRILVLHPTGVQIHGIEVPDVLRRGIVVEARDEGGVDAVGDTVRRGQDQVSPGRFEHRAAAAVQRAAAQEHRTHLGSGCTGWAAAGVAGATGAPALGWAAGPGRVHVDVNAASSPVARTIRPAADKRSPPILPQHCGGRHWATSRCGVAGIRRDMRDTRGHEEARQNG